MTQNQLVKPPGVQQVSMSKAILLTTPLGLLKVVTSRSMGIGLVSTPYLILHWGVVCLRMLSVVLSWPRMGILGGFHGAVQEIDARGLMPPQRGFSQEMLNLLPCNPCLKIKRPQVG